MSRRSRSTREEEKNIYGLDTIDYINLKEHIRSRHDRLFTFKLTPSANGVSLNLNLINLKLFFKSRSQCRQCGVYESPVYTGHDGVGCRVHPGKGSNVSTFTRSAYYDISTPRVAPTKREGPL